MSDDWYYTNRGRQLGPMPLLQLAEELHEIPHWREEYVWRSGFDNWVRAGSVDDLAIIPSSFPRRPIPPHAASQPRRRIWPLGLLATGLIALGAGAMLLKYVF